MGALTSNRKRGDEYLSLNYPTPYQYSHVSKRPRFSFMQQTTNQNIISSSSVVSRISRYPDDKPPLKRAVQGPCRTLKFGLAGKLNQVVATSSKNDVGCRVNERVGSDMGNILEKAYVKAKRNAFGAFRYWGKDKEVIDADNGEEKKVILSDDSSVEEVEDIEDGRGGRSFVFGQRWRESDEKKKLVDDGVELDGKAVEERNYNNLQPSSSSVVTDMNNGVGDGDIFRVENTEKMLDSLSLRTVSDVEAYKKLFDSAQKRGSKLKALNFQIELNEQRLTSHRLLRPVKKPEEKPVKEALLEPFVPLTEEEEDEVERAFSANRREILVTHSETGIDITGHFLQCLKPGTWLNDEVINVYLGLLKEREKREPQKYLKCHFFNTFFYNKLASGNFKAVKRWTTFKKLGYNLIECDKIFVPIHKQIHWCLAVINKKDKKFQYLDSLRGKDKKVLNDLARYFVQEVKDKSGKDIDLSDWKQEFVEDLPEQENGYDCGMFMLKYVDFYSRDIGLCFEQSHMPYFRLRTAKEILRLRAD